MKKETEERRANKSVVISFDRITIHRCERTTHAYQRRPREKERERERERERKIERKILFKIRTLPETANLPIPSTGAA
mgnify:CR=1 FL=1